LNQDPTDLGICGMDQGSSLAILTMQHEIVGYVEHIMHGIEINDETLGLDVIRNVGPSGTFLKEDHTALHFRSELWFPKLLDRNYFEIWTKRGRTDMLQRCRELKDDILHDHEVEPLRDDVLKEMAKLLDDAKRHLL